LKLGTGCFIVVEDEPWDDLDFLLLLTFVAFVFLVDTDAIFD